VKDGIGERVVNGRVDAVNPALEGTKAAAHYLLEVPGGGEAEIRLRLLEPPMGPTLPPNELRALLARDFDDTFVARRADADAFYTSIIPASLSEDEGLVMRQALAGMLWSKQFYYYDVDRWLGERGSDPFGLSPRQAPRNEGWHHLYNADVISMPDKWEYPWYAAWDLAFHVLALTLVDREFGKQQLELMLRDQYLHPSGQLPAYEWNFSDVNPPVHAWSTIFTYRLESGMGKSGGDVEWLERMFQKLLLNFTWWVNRKDRDGSNLFEGGFLGLDNIGVFDRSKPLPTGGYLEQADGTAWMALFCQNMVEIASELAMVRPAYAEMAEKFIVHFLWIGTAMLHAGHGMGMWDEEDGFFYDVLRRPGGEGARLKVRSMVGLLPMCAVTSFDGHLLEQYPDIAHRLTRFLEARPELRAYIHDPIARGQDGRRLASILDEDKLRRVLARMLDVDEFLSPHGIRSLSRYHLEHPYVLAVDGTEFRVGYLPAESDTGMFGGNSNWRGPVWMPVNALIIRALLQYYAFYGDAFRVECPTGSGNLLTLYEVAEELGNRLAGIFLRDEDGRRPVYGDTERFQQDPNWRDLILFYEYFHGDNGAGIGASHQTGWTGIIARSLHLFATTTGEEILARGPGLAVAEF
jgi:mannosylglycerate hydrolase MGH1-like protein